MNPYHIVVEHHNTNISQRKCFRKAETDAEFKRRDHDPPCLLQQAALPVTTRVLLALRTWSGKRVYWMRSW